MAIGAVPALGMVELLAIELPGLLTATGAVLALGLMPTFEPFEPLTLVTVNGYVPSVLRF